jgi:hypothetical protein
VRSAQFGGRTYLQSALLSSERHVQTLDSGRISRIPRYNVACTPLTHTQRHPSLGEVDFFWGGTHLGRVKNKRTKPALEMAAPAVARAPRQDPVGAYADLRAVAELRGTCRYSAIAWAPRCWPEPRLFECGKLKKWGGVLPQIKLSGSRRPDRQGGLSKQPGNLQDQGELIFPFPTSLLLFCLVYTF